MILNRPASLLSAEQYCGLPQSPFLIDWTSVPETIRLATIDLSGIQPITDVMITAAGGTLQDKPGNAEIELFRTRGTTFQLISVVLSCVAAGKTNGTQKVRPFAINLIPASKRGKVDSRPIDEIATLDVSAWLRTEPIYTSFDPFSGEWGMYGNFPGYFQNNQNTFFDEVGIVVDQYFLQTSIAEQDKVRTFDIHMPSDETKARYERHRNKLLFKNFKEVQARRIWGVETPIELFVMQALAMEELFPECQILITEDGRTFRSLYNLWSEIDFRYGANWMTEADLYFPEQRVAVFCDGGTHSRQKQREKDAKIVAKLEALGIRAIRIQSAEIQEALPEAVTRIKEALK